MSRRNNLISVYVDEELEQEVQAAADREGMSRSGFVASVLDHHFEHESIESKSREHRVEERIEELVAQASEDVAAATEGLHEMIAKQGVYTIAMWELLKRDHGDKRRQHALSVGSERLRDDWADIVDAEFPDVDVDDSGGDTGYSFDTEDNDDSEN